MISQDLKDMTLNIIININIKNDICFIKFYNIIIPWKLVGICGNQFSCPNNTVNRTDYRSKGGSRDGENGHVTL